MLSCKKKKFCEYYCGEGNGNIAQSAILAGYSSTYASKRACEFMKDPEILDYIKELTVDETNARIASIDKIQEFWTNIMNDEEQATKDRLRASEMLAKVKGMFNVESW